MVSEMKAMASTNPNSDFLFNCQIKKNDKYNGGPLKTNISKEGKTIASAFAAQKELTVKCSQQIFKSHFPL